jgi:hypothetical protein
MLLIQPKYMVQILYYARRGLLLAQMDLQSNDSVHGRGFLVSKGDLIEQESTTRDESRRRDHIQASITLFMDRVCTLTEDTHFGGKQRWWVSAAHTANAKQLLFSGLFGHNNLTLPLVSSVCVCVRECVCVRCLVHSSEARHRQPATWSKVASELILIIQSKLQI